ncbi:hypothetical protein ABIF68_001972 [Bradyrhizobium japonicum]
MPDAVNAARNSVNPPLTIKLQVSLTIKIRGLLIINVRYSFAEGVESATSAAMNEIIFLAGDWPVRTIDALIGFGALVVILLVVIAVVIARSGRRGAELAMANAIRADELEERLSQVLHAQSEAAGRADAMTQALAGRQADMGAPSTSGWIR